MAIKILCPYCDRPFEITERQAAEDPYFSCPHCGEVNAGGSKKNSDGIIIGTSIENYLAELEDDDERVDAEEEANEYRG